MPNKKSLSAEGETSYRSPQDTKQKRKKLQFASSNTVARRQILVNHRHMELWNMTKKIHCLYGVPDKFLSADWGGVKFHTAHHKTHSNRRKKTKVASSNRKDTLIT